MDETLIELWFATTRDILEQEEEMIRRITMGALVFARIMNTVLPDSPDKTVAFRKLRECVFMACEAAGIGRQYDPRESSK